MVLIKRISKTNPFPRNLFAEIPCSCFNFFLGISIVSPPVAESCSFIFSDNSIVGEGGI